MKHFSLILFLCLLIQGCASPSYVGRFETIGKFQPEMNLAIEEKAKEMAWAEADDIDVYIGDMPEGITWDGTQFYSEIYNVRFVGRVHTNPEEGLVYTVYAEDDEIRQYLCPINMPFTIATLGIWRLISPSAWPCNVNQNSNKSEDIAIRKNRMIKTLKKTVKAAGGNTLVVTSLGRTDFINKNTNELVNSVDMTNSEGMALLITPKTPFQSKI